VGASQNQLAGRHATGGGSGPSSSIDRARSVPSRRSRRSKYRSAVARAENGATMRFATAPAIVPDVDDARPPEPPANGAGTTKLATAVRTPTRSRMPKTRHQLPRTSSLLRPMAAVYRLLSIAITGADSEYQTPQMITGTMINTRP